MMVFDTSEVPGSLSLRKVSRPMTFDLYWFFFYIYCIPTITIFLFDFLPQDMG